jgi:hypothetical protein
MDAENVRQAALRNWAIPQVPASSVSLKETQCDIRSV